MSIGLFAGMVVGAAVSLSAFYSISKSMEENLSDTVILAEVVQNQPPDPEKYPLPEDLTTDRALIAVYLGDFAGESDNFFISTQEYFQFKQMGHVRRDWRTRADAADLVDWVTSDNASVHGIALHLTQDLDNPEAKAQLLLDFVHSHLYDVEIEFFEDYVRYPLETIIERNGDCEDLAILGAALMKSIGLDVALIKFRPSGWGESGHLGLAVAGDFSGKYFNINGTKYFYAESTGTHRRDEECINKIGEFPPLLRKRATEVYVVK